MLGREPVVYVVLWPHPTGDLWLVARCPICGEPHVHDAGTPRNRILGDRPSPCLRRPDGAPSGYRLVWNGAIRPLPAHRPPAPA